MSTAKPGRSKSHCDRGSVGSSVYGSRVGDFCVGKPAPKAAVDAAKNSLGGAIAVAQNLAKTSIPGAKQISEQLVRTANEAFVDAFHWGAIVGACVLALGALIVVLFLPARPSDGLAPTPVVVPDDVVDAAVVEEVLT